MLGINIKSIIYYTILRKYVLFRSIKNITLMLSKCICSFIIIESKTIYQQSVQRQIYYILNSTTLKQLQIGKSVISSISAATSLGCIMGSKLNMSQHVSRV